MKWPLETDGRGFDESISRNNKDVEDLIQQCLSGLQDFEMSDAAQPSKGTKAASSPKDPNTAFSVLKASNIELRRLAGSKMPDSTYRADFGFADEKKSLITKASPLRSTGDTLVGSSIT